MALIVKGKNFDPAPEGTHQAVCVDVIDKGWKKGQRGDYEAVELRWQTEATDPKTGKRYLVFRQYGKSIGRKSDLGKHLRSWRGKDFTPEEFQSFDLETVIGANCLLTIVHNNVDGTVYGNVDGVMGLPKGMEKIEIEDYVRDSDRAGQLAPADDEEIPF